MLPAEDPAPNFAVRNRISREEFLEQVGYCRASKALSASQAPSLIVLAPSR
ncbi:hypothetical protein QOV31_004985 (plasmid) [Agrobacterium fabrum]|nr:hypothetical protein QOV31_004985 [Agrobacterium fabrum]CAD0217082.1 hypothetical protein AGTUEHA105_LOCUS5011 [Agrobacterium tumefaciens]CAH0273588.1 hypothetical protein SRABI46_03821 [Agrobacterium fabrum]CAH0276151.1 hypothetical protein SRABI05_03651 [Agrobacterium fabrum]SDB72580.1 hypothetical protein SAMN03159422_04525 [Agrobacterium fabrum]